MESDDYEMLDDVPPDSRDPLTELSDHNWSILDKDYPELILSSSPMSLGEEYFDARYTDPSVDSGDFTSPLSQLHDPDERELTHSTDLNHPALNEDIAISSVTSPIAPKSSGTHDRVIAQIESVFERIADAMLAERGELSIELNTYRQANTNESIGSQQTGHTRSTTVTFPGRSPEEAWRFTVVIRLLEMIHEAISSGLVLTKRDMYYRDPSLFGKQSVVDRHVDQIALAFSVPRSCLNITAAAKGLMAGAVSLCRRDGSRLDLSSNTEGTLIPSLEDILSVDMDSVKWVLVIEKEATFQSIITSVEWQSLRWQGVIMTGKGYPDLATRAMARFITRATPNNGFITPQIYGLMDFDPDGLAILLTYKYGSLNKHAEDLVVPDLKCLGLKSNHVKDGDQTHQAQGLMSLTKRDRHKARKMLEQDRIVERGNEAEWRGQLQVMLVLNLKAELQSLDAAPGTLMDLIQSAVQ